MRRLAIPAVRPTDQLLDEIREAVLEAFPERAPGLLRAIECLGWGEPHSPALERVPHCRFCAAVEGPRISRVSPSRPASQRRQRSWGNSARGQGTFGPQSWQGVGILPPERRPSSRATARSLASPPWARKARTVSATAMSKEGGSRPTRISSSRP